MRRRCDGTDENLLQIIDSDGKRVSRSSATTTHKPCDCGLVFDDARREVIWPHPVL